ncbi:sugar ABC transporter substrate-binding protein [Falsiroseomonas bella]|uniref:Sugar ABC transporter substrate-binding protein n=1 Tax=Falsiroseomonas bella TaxID=2184016 RepID=A0A317FJY0_9PROT|nr:XrtA/PEP-CTERM system exopolysaccharide export protein [Falsiroseomonas bella]PWS39374.1 sugar ABC transporter substrate-binding protein [Falsiroseomonas bella]
MRVLRAIALLLPLAAAACQPPPAEPSTMAAAPQVTPDYVIGPGDSLSVFVFRSPELSMEVPVRPDGRISLPLVEDIEAAGRTPVQLSRQIEERLKQYVREPSVTVIVRGFVGPASRQVRIVGEAAQPRAIAFREGMTVLDALIEAGGLTRYAAGNSARLIRRESTSQETIPLRLNDLLRTGDLSQDLALRPGDTLVIPQGWF